MRVRSKRCVRVCDTDRISNMDKILTQRVGSPRYVGTTHTRHTRLWTAQRARFTHSPRRVYIASRCVFRLFAHAGSRAIGYLGLQHVPVTSLAHACLDTSSDRQLTHSTLPRPVALRAVRTPPPRLFAPTPSRPISALIATRRSSSRSPLARFSHGVTAPCRAPAAGVAAAQTLNLATSREHRLQIRHTQSGET